MPERVDYDAGADRYRHTRTVASDVLDLWRAAISPYFEAPVSTVVDVGAGTGQFAGPIAEWFGAHVVAVEPSSGMREAAEAHPAVHLVAGRGEALPIATGSVERAWLSAVVHHFTDLGAVADELHRVLVAGGVALVRGFFSDVEPPAWFQAFPGIERSAAVFPSTGQVTAALEAHGMRAVSSADVVETHPVGGPWDERLRQLRPVDSLLRPLSDQEFEAGMAALAERLPTAGDALTHRATLRLLVFESHAG